MRGVLDLKGILNTDETPSRLLIHCLYCDFSHYVLLQMKNEWPEVWTITLEETNISCGGFTRFELKLDSLLRNEK